MTYDPNGDEWIPDPSADEWVLDETPEEMAERLLRQAKLRLFLSRPSILDSDFRTRVNEVKAKLALRLGGHLTLSVATDNPTEDFARTLQEIEAIIDAPTFEAGDNDYFGTISGKHVMPMAMEPDMFDIKDMAHNLSRICRYNGAVAGFISVAWHSVRVAKLIEESDEPWFALEGLMHDGMEAYIGDIVNPIKRRSQFASVLEAEASGERSMATKFGLVYPWPVIVKWADKTDGETERGDGGRRHDVRATVQPDHAREAFLATYERLVMERRMWAKKLAEFGIAS